MTDARERYRLDLIALPDSAPAVVRLRRVLKALLRSYGFKCESAVQLPSEGAAADQPREGKRHENV